MTAMLWAAWRLVTGWVAGIYNWLRQPGSWIKVLLAFLALWASIASISSYHANQKIVVITNARQADQITFKARAAEYDSAIAGYRDQQTMFARVAREESARLEASRLQSQQAMNEVAALQATAEQGKVNYRRVYDSRPDSCKAALEALDAACPTLQGY